jgi:hypothetical protein
MGSVLSLMEKYKINREELGKTLRISLLI